ncbi:MAG: hypothetical protein H7288_21075 [Kineosporiaceae bacterium]|nr:hypothetical protein [Aeromicrobium sp.]
MTDERPDRTHTSQAKMPSNRPLPPPQPSEDDDHTGPAGRGGHRLMMIACCVPMLIIVGVLVATGVAGSGFIIYAVACTAMMAMMMFMMPGDRH